MISGVCRFCGCTNERACRPVGGEPCQWIDQEETVCSGCLGQLGEEDLAELWLQEFMPEARHALPALQFDVSTGFALLATLQLALKHPDFGQISMAADVAREVADGLGELLGQLGPLTAETVRRGFDGCYQPDQSVCQSQIAEAPRPSGLILPESFRA